MGREAQLWPRYLQNFNRKFLCSYQQDSPLPAAVQQPGDQVRVKGGTHPPLKLLHKLQKLDSADTDLVSKLLKDKVALLRSSQSASF